MKIAIMQPYFFPFIGYFQLVNAVDKFVFYDDVNYIKRGWINRNRILSNEHDVFITIPLKKASQNYLINETYISYDKKQINKILTTIRMSYTKAPFYNEVYGVIEGVFENVKESYLISELAANTVIRVSEYLGIETVFEYSSKLYSNTKGLDKAERLMEICKANSSKEYINVAAGRNIYSKEMFAVHNIDIKFIESKPIEYKQYGNEFIPWLSIIDVLMFNSVDEVRRMLNQYSLT